jgi:hypothetical protein
MLYYAEQVDGSHCVLCWAGCVGIMVCYAKPVDGNHGVNSVPVGVNYGKLCWAGGYESLCGILCQ